MRPIFYLENTLKAFGGMTEGLLDDALITKKQNEEKEFRRLVESSAEWNKAYGSAWDEYANSTKNYLSQMKPFRYRRLTGSGMASLALQIVQYVAEVNKPDGERLKGLSRVAARIDAFRPLLTRAAIYGDGRGSSRERASGGRG